MALRVPESKFRDHFSIQTSPQNPQKATSGTHIGPQKVIFGHFAFFWYFGTIFQATRAIFFKFISTHQKLDPDKKENFPQLLKHQNQRKTLAHWLIFMFTIFYPTYCKSPWKLRRGGRERCQNQVEGSLSARNRNRIRWRKWSMSSSLNPLYCQAYLYLRHDLRADTSFELWPRLKATPQIKIPLCRKSIKVITPVVVGISIPSHVIQYICDLFTESDIKPFVFFIPWLEN